MLAWRLLFIGGLWTLGGLTLGGGGEHDSGIFIGVLSTYLIKARKPASKQQPLRFISALLGSHYLSPQQLNMLSPPSEHRTGPSIDNGLLALLNLCDASLSVSLA